MCPCCPLIVVVSSASIERIPFHSYDGAAAAAEAAEEGGIKKLHRITWAKILWGSGGNNWRVNKPLLDAYVRKCMGDEYSQAVEDAVRNYISNLDDRW